MSEVLALKYRPSTFDKLIGQDTIRETLTMALDQNKLSYAYLFSGLRGSGKTSTARIFAKSMICEKGPTSTPCQECQHCKLANENRHIDIIEMDAASSRKIDDIRSLIEHTKYKPNSARFKIFIIDEVHMLTKEAFNALLKTLEEPPEYVKFILATTDPMKLPPTILSRTQHYRFKKINQVEVIKHLSHILNLEKVEYEKKALMMLTRAGNGSLRDTLTLLDQAIIYSKNMVDAQSVASMLGILDPEFIESIFEAIFNKDRDRIISMVKELENYESEVVIDEIISFVKEHFFQQDPRFSTMLTDRFFRILSESKNLLFLNADSLFVLTLLFFKMVEATKIKDIDEMITQLEQKVSIPSVNKPLKKEINDKNITPVTEKEEPNKEHEIKQPQIVNDNRYELLLEKLSDRNFELGECFSKSIEFISFEEDKLTLSSCADENCKNILRKSSGVIKYLVKESFGIKTKIVMKACEKKNDTKNQIVDDKKDDKKLANKEEPPTEQSTSCIANHVVDTKDEINPDDILEHDFVKKAQELFEPKKIIIKSKV